MHMMHPKILAESQNYQQRSTFSPRHDVTKGDGEGGGLETLIMGNKCHFETILNKMHPQTCQISSFEHER